MKASDWISVEDRLPKIGERVMVYQSFNDGSTFARMATRVKINQTNRWYDDEGFEIEYITHWEKIVLPKKEMKNTDHYHSEIDANFVECPQCGSKQVFIKEGMFTTLYQCLKCGNEWRP